MSDPSQLSPSGADDTTIVVEAPEIPEPSDTTVVVEPDTSTTDPNEALDFAQRVNRIVDERWEQRQTELYGYIDSTLKAAKEEAPPPVVVVEAPEPAPAPAPPVEEKKPDVAPPREHPYFRPIGKKKKS